MEKSRAEKLCCLPVILFLSLLFGGYILLMLESMRSGTENYAITALVKNAFLGSGAGISGFHIAAAIFSAAACFLISLSLLRSRCRLLRFLLKYRWQVSAVIFLVIVLLDINNTSLHIWSETWDPGLAAQTQPLWGVARNIRSDEWATWSVFSISQGSSGFQAVNPLMSAGSGVDTAWISVGGIPAFSLSGFFKPFYWGFLFLGISRGYSFLFAARILLLFNVSYEAALRYTHKNTPFSLAAAMLFTLSPYVQWWFSQSIAEVLIFGQGMILCLMRYLEEKDGIKKWLWSAMLFYTLGCFVMISYVAWLVAAAWLIIPVCIMLLVQRRDHLHKADLLCLLLPLLVTAGLLGIIVHQSWDTLMAVKNSIYPGTRLITGGLFRVPFVTDAYSALLPFIRPDNINQCTCASFITFAPLGLILWICGLRKSRKAEAFDIILAAGEAVALFFNCFHIPVWLAQITLLSQANRIELLFGVADTILLLRSLCRKGSVSWYLALLFAVIIGAARILLIRTKFDPGLIVMMMLLGLYVAVIYVLLISGRGNKTGVRAAAVVLGLVAILGGCFVNPLQVGISAAQDMQIVRDIQAVDPDRDSTWIVEGTWPATELPLLAGRKTLSTQAYPNVSFWKDLDPREQYINEYNRLCHISIALDEGSETTFRLRSADQLQLSLTPDDLKTLQVGYIMTTKRYPPDSAEGFRFHLECESGPWLIYSLTN